MSKSVTEQEWREKAAGLAEWRKKRTSLPNLDLYRKIVSMVHISNTVFDCGAGQGHLKKCLPTECLYMGADPFPISNSIVYCEAENLDKWGSMYGTVFMLSALDNVKDLKKSLEGLKSIVIDNIVILTGIGIPPNAEHTVQVDREDLVSVLGEPFQEVEISNKLFLFEWRI